MIFDFFNASVSPIGSNTFDVKFVEYILDFTSRVQKNSVWRVLPTPRPPVTYSTNERKNNSENQTKNV